MTSNRWIWLLIVPACLSALYIAIGHPSEYGHYVLSRFLVTAAAAASAFLIWERHQGLGVFLTAIAALFNPFIKVHLGRELWAVADLVAVVVLLVAGVAATRGLGRQA